MSALKVRVYRILKKITEAFTKLSSTPYICRPKKPGHAVSTINRLCHLIVAVNEQVLKAQKMRLFLYDEKAHSLMFKSYLPVTQCLFQLASFFGKGEPPPPRKTYNSPNGWQLVCCESIFRPGTELQIYHENILLMDNKHGKLFVIKQPEGSDVKSIGLGLGLES